MPRVRKIKTPPIYNSADVDKRMGSAIGERDCKILIDYDADVYCSETGECIAKFRKGVIPSKIQKDAWDALKNSTMKSDTRLNAAGEFTEFGNDRFLKQFESNKLYNKIYNDGTVSKTNRGLNINSGIIGYFDREPRRPFCRQTAFNQKQFPNFVKAYPILKFVDSVYADLMPTKYKLQKQLADETSQDFVITDTAFTTVTVNKNWETALHTDKGDFKDGFGNLTVLRAGNYTGGNLVLFRWGVGFDLHNGDVLLMNVHEAHANTPIVMKDNATRLSLVMYYRENMKYCGTAKEELERAKTRKAGTKLNG